MKPVELSRPRRVGALLVPWTFVIRVGAVYAAVLLARLMDGHYVERGGVFAGMVHVVLVVAANTFSRDIVSGRWP